MINRIYLCDVCHAETKQLDETWYSLGPHVRIDLCPACAEHMLDAFKILLHIENPIVNGGFSEEAFSEVLRRGLRSLADAYIPDSTDAPTKRDDTSVERETAMAISRDLTKLTGGCAVKLKAKCETCGVELRVKDSASEFEIGGGSILLAVEPCARCLGEARDEGESQGFEEGHDEATEATREIDEEAFAAEEKSRS